MGECRGPRNKTETRAYHEFGVFEEYSKARIGTNDKKETATRDVANDLGEVGKTYRRVESGEGEDIAKFVARRNVMGLGVVTPLLLWLLDAGVSDRQLRNCLNALESYLVRRVVCGYSARGYGKLFVGLISKLAQDSADEPDRTLVAYLGEQESQAALWPSDSDLLERLTTAPLYRILTQGRLRMVLEGIEEQLRGRLAESREVPSNLHIEHVMPQAWRDNWPLAEDSDGGIEATKADRDRAIHTIGNLTLVNGRLNTTLSNAPWRKKRETLAEYSTLYLNKRLVKKAPHDWNEDAIRKRGAWIHKQFVKVWPQGGDVEF